MARASSLVTRIESALLWIAAFAYATGVFFSTTLALQIVPPTRPVAVGLVTILRYAKFQDYLGAALFFVLVPTFTIVFRRLGERLLDREQRLLAWRHPAPERDFPLTALFTVPFFFSPFFYLTTGKIGWVLLLPAAIAYGGTRLRIYAVANRWVRRMFRRELHPYHGLLFAEAMSWVIFHDIVVGHRFAHIPTLFLEGVFVALFVALFWAVALLLTRVIELNFGREADEVFRRITTGAIPFVALPLAGILWVPTTHAGAIMIVVALVAALLAVRMRPLPPRAAWIAAACVMMPLLVFFVSYACTAHLSQWVDLFHRGESIGPASDYLRGKAPYREIFALHGMLQDGLLDAWLMQLFGRSLEVAVARDAIVGGFLGVSIWYLGVAIFESIPLASVVMAAGILTTAENDRTFFQVVAVALFWIALRRSSRVAAVLAGVVSAVALFFSYEIGMYSIVGAIAVAAVLAIVSRWVEWKGLSPVRAASYFVAGVVAGALPFLVYLSIRGSLASFADVSFVVIPRIIDAVWSLPFPDLVSVFRTDLSLRTIADFVVAEKFHLILTPLTIAIAAVYYIQRVIRRRADLLDHALMVIGVFATIAQRTAFGRAEFRHQYFSAYLTGPMLALLAIFAIRELRRSWGEGDPGSRAFLATVIVAAIPLLGVLLWVPDLINWRIGDLTDYQRRVLRVQRDPHAEEVWNRIEAVSGEIGTLTKKNEPIYDFSNQPAFYFFANRPNPTRFYQVPIASPPEFQAEIIRDLERARPKVVIRTAPEGFDEFDGVPNALRAQAVSAYIDDTYHFYRALRGVELWTRDPNARPRTVKQYLAKFRVPQPKELVSASRQRMVFPVVGSVHGASGAFWVSDLTLHNPWREPIDISLRLSSGTNRVDRRVALAPRQTLRWPDAARTLFAMPDGIGSLWLGYREGKAPIAVVKTSDVAHGGRASIQTPLTNTDVAIAGSGRDELMIVGIPGATAGRRVNIGVVNMGLIPATFRITARTQSGAAIGAPLESGVAEDELWFVSDIEKQLGISIGEATTLRVSVIAGTGVAFATVVDPSGDTQFIAALPAQQQ